MLSKEREKRLRHEEGCLTDCVAYLFNVHPMSVPYFVYPRKDWNKRLKNYFKKRGYKILWACCLYGTRFYKIPKRGMHIIIGDSLKYKNSSHAVVYKDGRLVYDPQYPSKWSDKRITHRLIIKKYE